MDTSVIVAYIDEADANHAKAVDIARQLEDHVKVVSELVLVELASVFSRAGFSEPLGLAIYSVRLIGAQLTQVDFKEVFHVALRYSGDLKLRTLNLLHIAASYTFGARVFATLDREIVRRKPTIASLLGIEVLHPPSV
ncbi:MAG: PIN domain-containing protein [Thermofilaceae archaeon]